MEKEEKENLRVPKKEEISDRLWMAKDVCTQLQLVRSFG